ncbi:MAG: hypothetical protein H0W72_01970 [Planctomycetes bacterium]|nr:hypothetical protein [Planctomycetota bacterium]
MVLAAVAADDDGELELRYCWRVKIPIPVELPLINEPSMLQLDTAKQNTTTARDASGDDDLVEVPSPYAGNGAMPLSRSPLNAQASNTLDWTPNIGRQDAIYEQGLYVAGQILPHGSSGSDLFQPFTRPGAAFPFGAGGQGYDSELSERTLVSLLTDGLGARADVAKRLDDVCPPAEIWRRYALRYLPDGFVDRGETDPLYRERLALEVQAKRMLEFAAAARFKRFYSITIDAEDPSAPTPPFSQGLRLPMSGDRIQGSIVTIPSDSQIRDVLANFFGVAGISALFQTSISPDWNLGHPLTEEVVNHMISERTDYCESLLKAMEPGAGGRWPLRAVFVDSSGQLMNQTDVFAELWDAEFEVAFNDDRFVEIRFEPSLWNMMTGNRTVELAMNGAGAGVYTIQYEGETFSFRLIAENDRMKAIVVAQDEIYRLLLALNNRSFAQFWQQFGSENKVGMAAFMVGDAMWGMGDALKLSIGLSGGLDYETGQRISRTEMGYYAIGTAMNVVPGGLILKQAGKVMGSVLPSGSSLAKALRGNVARVASGSKLDSAIDALADSGEALATQAARTAPPRVPGGDIGPRRLDGMVSIAAGTIRSLLKATIAGPEIWRFHADCVALAPHVGVVKGATRARAGMFRPLGETLKRTLTSVASLRNLPRNARELVQGIRDTQDFIDGLISDLGPVEALRRLEKLRATACFAGHTPVLLADGARRPIADMKIGDLVLTRRLNQPGGGGIRRPRYRSARPPRRPRAPADPGRSRWRRGCDHHDHG